MSKHNDALKRSGTTVRKVVSAILATWNASTASERERGAQWYGEAGAIAESLASNHGHKVETVAAVIAHCSPQLQWGRNVAAAAEIVSSGGRIAGLMSTSYANAMRALEASDPLATLNGPKVRRFAANILGDEGAVTVDVWASRVALPGRDDHQRVIARSGVYAALEHCYRLAAARVGVAPATMQATTWIVARNGRHA